jgi:hypothetical protein
VALGLVVYLKTCRIVASLKYTAQDLEADGLSNDVASTANVAWRQAQFSALLPPEGSQSEVKLH